jgi:hypothetical protein
MYQIENILLSRAQDTQVSAKRGQAHKKAAGSRRRLAAS